MKIFNLLKKKVESPTIEYLKREKNLNNIDEIADQIASKAPLIHYKYKDDRLCIINERAALYHIVNSTPKMEKLAGASDHSGAGVMLDIGANIGLFTYYFKKRFPKVNVFLFEPDLQLIPIIEANLAHFDSVEILNIALGDSNQHIDFFSNPFSSQTNSTELEALLPFVEKENIVKTTVPSVTLDQFCSDRKIEYVETLKIDIQGAEFKVLQAGEGTLKNTREAFVEMCFLMPHTIPLIKLLDKHFRKYQPVTEIIMGADLRFYN